MRKKRYPDFLFLSIAIRNVLPICSTFMDSSDSIRFFISLISDCNDSIDGDSDSLGLMHPSVQHGPGIVNIPHI